MANKLTMRPRKVAIGQTVETDASGSIRVSEKGLPVKTAVVDAAAGQREENQDG